MKILKIEGADEFHGAPKDWNGEVNGECAVLPTVKMSSNGVMFRVSQHEFTPDEIEAINNGATLYLWVSSLQHPVVSIGIEGVDYSKPEPYQESDPGEHAEVMDALNYRNSEDE